MAPQCKQDDIIPLSEPLTTRSGKVISSIPIKVGTIITIPTLPLNKSKLLWGEDSLQFKPERWLNSESGITGKAKELQGYHHLITFLDGPRTCLGRGFALGEIKVSGRSSLDDLLSSTYGVLTWVLSYVGCDFHSCTPIYVRASRRERRDDWGKVRSNEECSSST